MDIKVSLTVINDFVVLACSPFCHENQTPRYGLGKVLTRAVWFPTWKVYFASGTA